MDALHGTEDKVIDFTKAQNSFSEFKKHKNSRGEFLQIAGMSHTLNDEGRFWLKNKVDAVLTSEI